MEWSTDDFVDWICNIEQGKYQKYEQTLRTTFKSEGVSGKAIPFIEKSEWKEFGIKNYMDRTNIHQHIQNLKSQNNNTVNNVNNEIAPADNEGGNITEYH